MKIFLSYSHTNKPEADCIDSFLQTQGYTVIRGIRNAAFKDDLHDFCGQIRECQAAVTLVSAAYLQSRWCMYEILQLLKDRDCKAKIFPVAMAGANIFTAEDRLDYMHYWQKQYADLLAKTPGLDLAALPEIAQELKLYTYIKTEIGAFTATIGNWKIWQYEEQAAKNFADLILPLADLKSGNPAKDNPQPDHSATDYAVNQGVAGEKVEVRDCQFNQTNINQYGSSPAPAPARIGIPGRPYIIGRAEQLKLLHSTITTNQPLLLVNGLGGIGKTTLAQEYVNDPRYNNDYTHIAWVTVDRAIKQSMILALQPAYPVNLSTCTSIEEQFTRLTLYMENLPGKKLLVLDNVNDQNELSGNRYQLESLHWYVLITTRCAPDEMQKLPVDELPAADACTLFLHHYHKDRAELSAADNALLEQLLKRIHFHTLLTELLAKAGCKKGLTLTAIGEKLNQADYKHTDFQREISAGRHAESLHKDMKTRLHDYILALFEPEQLTEQYRQCVRVFSILPPADIPFAHLKLLFAVAADTENAFEDQLAELASQGWINCKNQACKMHPLVQDVAREKLQPDPDNCTLLVTTLSWLMQQSATIAYDYLQYTKAVTEKITAPDDNIASLLIDFSDACFATGNIQQALESIGQSKNLLEHSNDKYRLAIAYERSGRIYQALGQFDQALHFFELRAQLGKELYEGNPKSEQLKNGLAISYEKLGDLHQALGQFDQALHFFELDTNLTKELYEGNPKSMELADGMAISFYKLGGISLQLEQQEKAHGCFQQALAIWEQLFAFTKLEKFKGYIEHVQGLMEKK